MAPYQQDKPTLEDGFTVIKALPLIKQLPIKRDIGPLLEEMK
jgi:hypothetical protein